MKPGEILFLKWSLVLRENISQKTFDSEKKRYYMTRNIYALLNDHSAEADKFIEEWNKCWTYHSKRTPRERLAKMANTLKGEEIVLNYLNEHDLINC